MLVTALLLLIPLVAGDDLPRPRFVILGQQGVGKSSLSNALLGYDNTAKDRQSRKKMPFKLGHGLSSKTQLTTFSTGQWLGAGSNITVVDSPGFKDTEDAKFVAELTSVLGDEVSEVDAFVIVFKYKNRFTVPFKRTLKMISSMFGNIWNNVVIDVSFWDADPAHEAERQSQGVTQESYTRDLQSVFKNKLKIGVDLPVVFLDSHYDRNVPEEVGFFTSEVQKLFDFSAHTRAFKCDTREQVKEKLDAKTNQMKKLKQKERKKRSKLTSKIRELKNSVKSCHAINKFYENQCQVKPGCKWTNWGDWGPCVEGNQTRLRSRLPAPGNQCQGKAKEVKQGCMDTHDHDSHWTEKPDTLAIIIGGRTEENSPPVSDLEVLTSSRMCSGLLPPLPGNPRAKIAAAYDEDTTVLVVCGGVQQGAPTQPTGSCWKKWKFGQTWEPIADMMEPVSGATAVWFNGKMFVIGGANGDDKKDNTHIVDKVQMYSPDQNSWSEATVFPRKINRACAVTIDQHIVVTGGTARKLRMNQQLRGSKKVDKNEGGKVSPWEKVPHMLEPRVGHGCSVVTVGGARGIMVAGGNNNGDSVEFLDWDHKDQPGQGHWIALHTTARQRRFGLAIASVGGKASVIGGLSWPSTVSTVEEFDAENEEWEQSSATVTGRFDHAVVTVPGSLFPSCT